MDETDTDFVIGQNSHEIQTEGRLSLPKANVISNIAKSLPPIDGSQLDVHKPDRSISYRVRSDLDSVVTTVETRVQNAILTEIESLAIPRVELAMESINAPSRQDKESVVPDPERFLKKMKDFI